MNKKTSRISTIYLLPFMLVLGILLAEEEKSESIKVESVTKHTTLEGRPIYLIEYNYNFKDLHTVYVEDLGLVPSKGEFTYLTLKPQVDVLKSPAGDSLQHLSLNLFSDGRLKIELPAESEFPDIIRSECWNYSASFPLIANKILNQKFKWGFMPYKTERTFKYITTFTQLLGLPKTVIGEISIMLSYPHNVEEDVFWFHVRHVARERRVKSSDWRNVLSKETKESIETFLDSLIRDIIEAGRNYK